MMGESEYKARERITIVAKYDSQRTPEILPGEEGPENQDHLDLYGFIYPNPVPDFILEKQRRIKQRDIKREKKWEKLMPKDSKHGKKASREDPGRLLFGHTYLHLDDRLFRPKKKQEKLVRRVYDGIPATFRSLIWTELLRIQGMRVDHAKYNEMVKRAKKSSPDIHQIDLDVNRTYRNTTYFRDRYGPRQRQLFDVLAAYSMYNTEVGYCQGMSEIAAFLLMHLNEEADVFWALHTLFTHQHWQMHGFFIKGFPKLNRFFEHHDRLLSKHMPRLFKHLQKMDIHPSCYAFKWYMQCFIGLPFTLTLRLWDIFLVIGEKLLVVMSFNIMKIIRRTLMKMDQSEILVFMQEPLRRRLAEYDDDKIIEDLKDAMNELQHDWRPPKPTVPEGPPSPDQFGGTPEPLFVQERQADQADVEATLRRSFQRSGSPRPPSSPSSPTTDPATGIVTTRSQSRSPPPPPLAFTDGSLPVSQQEAAPPSPYDNAPPPLMPNAAPFFPQTARFDPSPPLIAPPSLDFEQPSPAMKIPNQLPITIQSSEQMQSQQPQSSSPPPPPPPLVTQAVSRPAHDQIQSMEIPLMKQDQQQLLHQPIHQQRQVQLQQQQPYPTDVQQPSPPTSKPPSIMQTAHPPLTEKTRPILPGSYNGGVQRSAVPKSHSLPEEVALASQLDLIKDHPSSTASNVTRRVRSQASSPLDATPAMSLKVAPLESTI